jgi:hypothetical protein
MSGAVLWLASSKDHIALLLKQGDAKGYCGRPREMTFEDLDERLWESRIVRVLWPSIHTCIVHHVLPHISHFFLTT